MKTVLLFGTGSPILVDVAETLHRAGWFIAAGIQNRPVQSYLPVDTQLLQPHQITGEMLSLCFLVPLFTPDNRRQAALEADGLGLKLPAILIDPTAIVPRRLALGPGTFISAGCSVGADSEFDRFVFVNRSASVGHHARFGAFVSIGPGVTVAGGVTIGPGAMVGAGATILPGLCIGENAVIGAGSVVTRDVPSGFVVFGNPGRIIRPAGDRHERMSV